MKRHYNKFVNSMGKKFVPLSRANKPYKLYLNDIAHIYRVQIKGSRPPIPKFTQDDLEISSNKNCGEITDVEFEPLSLTHN